MILTVPLQAGTTLANVRYRWIVNGVEGSELSSGITQPITDFAEFRFDVSPPSGAEELIAYDATDSTNWNPAGYLRIISSQPVTPFSGGTGQVGFRTVTFQSVYEAVLRRLGLDPLGDAVTQDTARSITEHVTERCRTAWRMWDWPELTRTDERAYRQVWNSSTQYWRIGEDGVPDEVYYIPNTTYYKVLSTASIDPPVGTLPTNATYFIALDPVTHYVARDQVNRRPMGAVLNVYAANPSLNGCCSTGCLKFRPSEKGITICGGPATTVFVQYLLTEPVFTFVPFIQFKTYMPGDRVFYPTDGNCYRCIVITNNTLPTDTAHWILEPVPATFAPYLKAGVYADCRKEYPTMGDPQSAALAVAEAKDEAAEFIAVEIDELLEQGQKHHWMVNRGRWRNFYGNYVNNTWFPVTEWWCSEPWSGNIVFGLTDEGIAGAGAGEECDASYHPEIVAIKTVDGMPSLQGLDTVHRATGCTLVTIVIVVSGSPEEQAWRLDVGTANISDPGQQAPADFDSGNPKFWNKVG